MVTYFELLVNRVFLADKELNIVSYSIELSVLQYQTAVMREDFDTANEVLPAIPKESRARVAHFLEKQGFKKQALAVTTDPEHQFDLALQVKSRNASNFMSNKHFYSSANSIKLFKSQQKLTLWRNGDRSQIWQLRNVNSNWLQKHSEKPKIMGDSFSLRPQAEIKPLFNI